MPGACCVCMFSVSVSLNKLSMVVNIILAQVELLGLEELVEPPVLILLNGGEGVASCVHFCVKGSVGSARPA